MKPFVMIGVPHLGDLPDYFFKSVMGMKKGGHFLVTVPNHPVDLARNLIVQAFLEMEEATHLLMLDSDMTFPRETMERLLQLQIDHDLDVTSGTYFARTDTPQPHVYEWDRVDEEAGTHWYRSMAKEFADWVKGHPEQADQPNTAMFEPYLVKCDAVGAGCLMLSRRVCEAVYAANEESAYPWFENWPGSRGGEDFAFCRRAKALGFEIAADFGLQCNHYAPGNFIGREEFVFGFAVGEADEHNWGEAIRVEIGPDGRHRALIPGVKKRMGVA